jgi:glycosyltransferase involved in cell wall biosynthesis
MNSNQLPGHLAAHARGVTVVICCHNAAGRLVPTLRHLLAQQTSGAIPWEVLVVDNASTDGTAEAAQSVWPADPPAPLRVILEPRLGVGHARVRGLAEARYEYVSFVDDDNWVCSRWIETVVQVLDQDSQAGACMGAVEAVFETEAPSWFERYREHFAVGNSGPVATYITFWRLWGAGCSLRRTAWEQLLKAGFSLTLISRQGTQLNSGEDTEIGGALVLLGWKLLYDPRLQLRHFMPASRLNWSYLRRLWRGFGRANVQLSWYDYFALHGTPATWKARLVLSWAGSLFLTIQALARLRRALVHGKEGDHDQLDAESALGRVQTLLTGPLAYRRGMRRVQRLFLAGAVPADSSSAELRQTLSANRSARSSRR